MFREPAFADKSRAQRWAFGALAASVAALPLTLAVHTVVERRVIEERRSLYTAPREAGLEDALILIDGRVGTLRSMPAEDLTRNGTELTGSVLYGLHVGPVEDCVVSASYAGRTPYLYTWDRSRGHGSLTPIACP